MNIEIKERFMEAWKKYFPDCELPIASFYSNELNNVEFPNSESLLEERLKHYNINEFVSIIKEIDHKFNIPSNSMDIVLLNLILHDGEHHWCFEEACRLVKPGGFITIFDFIDVKDDIFREILLEFMPNHITTGIDPDKIAEKLEKMNFSKVEYIEKRKIGILKYKKN